MTTKQQCVEHWKRLKDAPTPFGDEQPVASQCAFCRANWEDCSQCPIMETTGFANCLGTPYRDANQAWHDWRRVLEDAGEALQTGQRVKPLGVEAAVLQAAWKRAAQAMIDFLENLP